MLVLLRASADRASPTSRLRPRPVPVMATEEPVLRPQLMGAAALTGTATGVAVSGFKVATLEAAAALYSGPLALPELPGSELGPYVLVRLYCHHHRLTPHPLASRGVGAEAHSRCSAPCARSPHPGARPRRAGELRALCRGQPARGGCDTSRGGHVRGLGRPAESGAKAVGLALRLGHWPGPRQGCSGRRARAAAHAAALPRTQVERGSSRARATVGLGLGLLTVRLGARAGQGHG